LSTENVLLLVGGVDVVVVAAAVPAATAGPAVTAGPSVTAAVEDAHSASSS